MVMRRVALGLVAVLAATVSLISAAMPQHHPNAYFILFTLEPLVVLVGGLGAVLLLLRRPAWAPGMLGGGLYALPVGVAFVTVFPLWLPQDDTILGAAFVGGLLMLAGTVLALAGALILAGRRATIAIGTGVAAGLLAFVGALAGGAIGGATVLRPQVIVLVFVVLAVALIARRAMLRPILSAAVGAALTSAVLLLRGPGDWASASTTVKLYSFPVILMGLAISAMIVDLLQHGRGDTINVRGQERTDRPRDQLL